MAPSFVSSLDPSVVLQNFWPLELTRRQEVVQRRVLPRHFPVVYSAVPVVFQRVVVRVWLSPVCRSIHGRSARRRLAVKRAQSVDGCGHGPGACEFFQVSWAIISFLVSLRIPRLAPRLIPNRFITGREREGEKQFFLACL
jgi:hypothetical protein